MEKNGKKKFLFVSEEALIGDLAWQIKKEGNEVKYYIHNKSQKDVCDGFVDKVDSWKDLVDWADVIVFDDIGFGDIADKLRKEGKLVVGGSSYTDNLEHSREFGQEEMKSLGIVTLPNWNFTDFEEAIKFIKDNPGRYVLKPSGLAQNEKELLFIGQEDDGRDVLQVLEHYKKNWSKKIKIFQLQKYASGVEVAIGAFFNGQDFVTPININFEHKRMFPGEIGPSTGEMGTSLYWSQPNTLFNQTLLKMKDKLAESGYVGYIDINCIANSKGIYPLEFTCFDEKTEILTREGWKSYSEVRIGDLTLSINPATRELSWKKVINKTILPYKGEMVKIGAKGKSHSAIDVLVTPEHKLLIDISGKTTFVKAGDLKTHTKVIRTGKWNCLDQEVITIPYYHESHALGKYKKSVVIDHPAHRIMTEDFLQFLGLYLAEGSMGSHRRCVNISQSRKNAKREKIENLLDRLPFKYTVQKNGYYQINSVQFCSFLKGLGLNVKAGEKFIPVDFKELHPKYLIHLIYGFALGDGNWHKRTEQMTLMTSSKNLADDLQEIIIKCGLVANIREVNAKGTKSIGGYTRKNNMYFLSIRKEKKDYWLDNRVIGREYYEGKIWDVEVEDWHTMLVRRNGKPFFSGNCRFGYPHISIAMEGVISPWGEMFHGIAGGQKYDLKTKRGFQVGVVIAVPPFPFNDPDAFRKYSEDATILFKKPNHSGVHLGDVKFVEDDWRLAGTSGYSLIVTGSGSTMDGARKQAYHRVKNIMIPNMFYRTDIGLRWYYDSDKLQTWGYIY